MRVSILFVFMMITLPAMAQEPRIVELWADQQMPYAIPHEVKEYEADCFGVVCAYQVVNPTLTLYLPKGEANGNVVVVLPGGGYTVEAVYHEGYEIAEFLAARGNVAAVLKYRLPNPETSNQPQHVARVDVQRALALLRENQEQWGFQAKRFGVLGFSAGSHLATSVSVNPSDNENESADFSMLIYGVTQMNPDILGWLERELYHRKLTPEEVAFESFLERVDSDTPPAFLAHSMDDEVCPYQESTLYAEQLAEHDVPVEMHLFPTGGHGWGPGRSEDGTDQWLELASNWLDRL